MASGFEKGSDLAAKLGLGSIKPSHNDALSEAIATFSHGDDKLLKQLTQKARMDGTELQIKAWNLLSELDFGDVITYSELAEGVRRPKAVRSLASACKKNNHILIIGCHRVVKKNGLVGKYAYGPELKTQLLEFESNLRN